MKKTIVVLLGLALINANATCSDYPKTLSLNKDPEVWQDKTVESLQGLASFGAWFVSTATGAIIGFGLGGTIGAMSGNRDVAEDAIVFGGLVGTVTGGFVGIYPGYKASRWVAKKLSGKTPTGRQLMVDDALNEVIDFVDELELKEQEEITHQDIKCLKIYKKHYISEIAEANKILLKALGNICHDKSSSSTGRSSGSSGSVGIVGGLVGVLFGSHESNSSSSTTMYRSNSKVLEACKGIRIQLRDIKGRIVSLLKKYDKKPSNS